MSSQHVQYMLSTSAKAQLTPTDCWYIPGENRKKATLAGRTERHREGVSVIRRTVIRTNRRDISRMKARCLLSTVDRLPTINEMQESDTEDADLDCSLHTMEEYVDSIKELSQPAPYPLHGPLRGHRRWMVRTCPRVPPVAQPVYLHPKVTHAPWTPVELSDVSLILIDQSTCDTSLRPNQNLLDKIVAQSVFAGLV
ncbi:uncharacterized protein si:ch73-6k14.2 [Labrus mixtus]|uniref:uncharacterized protein si:ch73-6k14.2 n=1 Tax=Labrus mixtus TaxID=508554 RepID=UPI0029C07FF3|nr:uncharacterized protein si:ch73-6k14.2 [Labrus mixtus]